MNSKNYLTTKNSNENLERHIYCDSIDDLLYYAASYYLYHDYGLDPTAITEIVAEGQKLEYAGWLPHEIVKFRDADTKEIIWTKQF